MLSKCSIELYVRLDGVAECYEARFVEISSKTYRPDVLKAHDPVFKGKGITTAVFVYITETLGVDLVSSKRVGDGEFLSSEMLAIWCHYAATGRAIDNPETGRFQWLASRQASRKTNI